MNARAPALGMARTEAGGGFLYGWLLIAIFIEYARPSNQLTFLEFPYFYSIVPLTLLLASLFSQGLRPMKDVFADRLAKWVLIFFGIVLLSFTVNGFDSASFEVVRTVLGYAFLFILIARIATTEKRIKGVIVMLVIAHLYLLAMNFNVLTDPTIRQYLKGGTFLGDGNDFSLSLCILFPCLIGIALGARSSLRKVLAWGGAAVIVIAIIATQSRGGTLGIAAVLAYLWLRSPNKLVSGVGIALVGAIVMLYAPPQYFQRMGTVSSMTIDGSAQGRLDAWSGAIGMGVKNPILGIGPNNFRARWGRTAHSTYMLAFAELGFPGFWCTLMLVFGNLWANTRLRRNLLAKAATQPDEKQQRSMQMLDLMNAGMVGFAVAGAFLSATFYPHMYVLTALLISARIMAARDASLQPAQLLANTRMLPNAGPPSRIQRNHR
jgi:O-antigen ligase